ncbi:MAG: hypothetical protein NTX03_05090 [Bacteroidetes bacterium]|nr:hypothetical protein [Bacteroidota bacterium]
MQTQEFTTNVHPLPTKEEWDMTDSYSKLVKLANINSPSKINENDLALLKLGQYERGARGSIIPEKEELINELKRDLPAIVYKLMLLAKENREELNLVQCLTHLHSCKSAKDFRKIILCIHQKMSIPNYLRKLREGSYNRHGGKL